MRAFILTLALLSSSYILAGPEQWVGEWEGSCKREQVSFEDGLPGEYGYSLKIREVDEKTYSWVIQYQGETARVYEMIKVENSYQGHWLLDEKNGLFIDMSFSEDKITSLFTIGGKIYVSEERLSGDVITSNRMTFFSNRPRQSQLTANPSTIVSSFYSAFSSQCLLVKR